jgi:hypothetical protein
MEMEGAFHGGDDVAACIRQRHRGGGALDERDAVRQAPPRKRWRATRTCTGVTFSPVIWRGAKATFLIGSANASS